MQLNITDEQQALLVSLLEDAHLAASEHIDWLNINPNEPDRAEQLASVEHQKELVDGLLKTINKA